MTRNLFLLSILAVSPLAGCPLITSIPEDSTSDSDSGSDATETDVCDDDRVASCQNLYNECVLYGGTSEDCLDAVVDFFECPDLDYPAGVGDDCEWPDGDKDDGEGDGDGFLDIDCTPVVEKDGFDNSIRSIHLSPDAPAVDVYVGSPWVYRSVGPELSFGDASEFYPSLPDYDLLTVVPNGTTGDELLFGDPTIFFQDSDLDLPGGCYTTVVYDNAANLDVVVLEDDYSPIPRGLIRLRAFHAAPSVGQVDLYDVTIPGAPVLVEEDLDFGNAGAVLELPAEALSLGLDVDDDGRADLVFDVPELAEGSVVNAFASEDAAGDIAIIAQLDGGTAVRIDPR